MQVSFLAEPISRWNSGKWPTRAVVKRGREKVAKLEERESEWEGDKGV